MATKERNQTINLTDTAVLRQIFFNNHKKTDVQSVDKVEIYRYDRTQASPENPHGLSLVTTLDPSQITKVSDGTYEVSVPLTPPLYTSGKYTDRWYIKLRDGDDQSQIDSNFTVSTDLWFSSPTPLVYDFRFGFRPNKLVKGTVRPLEIQITPNVPTASDLGRYYQILSSSAPVYIYIERQCGPCVPAERDLRMVADRQLADYRTDGKAYYTIDTREMEVGLYDVWFEMDFAGSVHVSDRNQLQIYEA